MIGSNSSEYSAGHAPLVIQSCIYMFYAHLELHIPPLVNN